MTRTNTLPVSYLKIRMQVIVETAGEYSHLLDWKKIRDVIRNRKGYPVIIANREDRLEQQVSRVRTY